MNKNTALIIGLLAMSCCRFAWASGYTISPFPANSVWGPYGPVPIPTAVQQFIQTFNDGGSVGAVNAAGQMAINVSSINSGSGDPFPQNFVYVYLPAPAYGLPAGVNQLLTYPNVQAYGSAMSINNSGEVAGTVGDGVGIWDIGNSTGDLDMGSGVQAGLAGIASQINDSGQAIMQNYEAGIGRVYVLSPTALNGYSANATDLTPQGSAYSLSLAVGINNHGDALYDTAPVGSSSPAFQAYLRVGSTHNGLTGATTYALRGSGYDMYQAVGLNYSGEVVGMAAIGPVGATYNTPALWTPNGGAIDINALISTHSGWSLQTVTGIDQIGDIEGTGLYNGVTTPFILWAPEPTNVAVIAIALIPATLIRRRPPQ